MESRDAYREGDYFFSCSWDWTRRDRRTALRRRGTSDWLIVRVGEVGHESCVGPRAVSKSAPYVDSRSFGSRLGVLAPFLSAMLPFIAAHFFASSASRATCASLSALTITSRSCSSLCCCTKGDAVPKAVGSLALAPLDAKGVEDEPKGFTGGRWLAIEVADTDLP